MGFIDRIFRRKPDESETEKRSIVSEETSWGLALNYNGYSTYKTSQALALSAVYRCVEVITNGVASLPIKLYRVDEKGFKYEVKNDLSYILSKCPNKKMNAYTFYKLMMKDVLMAGNAYALIMRDGKNVVGLQYIPAGLVSPIDKIDHIEYMVTGIKGTVRSEDIIHIMNYSDNGVIGISVLAHARRVLGIADAGDKAADNFFKSGGCTSGFLKFQGPSTGSQKDQILSAWNQATGGPNSGPNGIAVLPSNVDYTQLSVDPADAQLLESRQFSVVEICRFFGVSPSMAFDLSHASYNNSEMAELAFLNDTLRPILTKIEMELEIKLFSKEDNMDIKFDVNELLRTDKKSQAEYFQKLFNMGTMSPNDIRKELDLEPVEGGDLYVAQVNLTSIKNLETINYTADNRLKERKIITKITRRITMIRSLNKHSDLKDLIKSCPSGVIDDIYAIEYYIQGYNTVIQANFTKKGSLLEVILPSSDLETLPNGILMRRAFYKVLDASYPDGYYNLEFEDNLNVWLGEVESEEPIIPEYITEEELAETLEDYATTEDVTTAVSDLGGRIDDLENAGYITSSALSGYATESWVSSQSYLTSASLSDYATKSYVDNAISDIPVPENVVQYDVDHPLIEDFGLNMDVLKRNVFDHGTDVLTKGLVLSYQEYKVDDEVKMIDTIELRSNQLWKVNYDKTVDYHETRDPYVLQSDLSSYATKDWISEEGYITSDVLTSYATQQWVNQQDFASDSDLDSLETRVSVLEHGGSPVTLAWGGISGTITDQTDLVSYVSTQLSGYATQSWVGQQGYITSSALSWGNITGDISEQTDLNDALNQYVPWNDFTDTLAGYALQSWATNQFLEESKVWTGTQAQWNQLSAAEKASYTIALITQ